jgi:hypothetical protein
VMVSGIAEIVYFTVLILWLFILDYFTCELASMGSTGRGCSCVGCSRRSR